jgi:hypothetical protein
MNTAAAAHDADLHALCEAWVTWRHTRRLFGPAPGVPSVLGRFVKRDADRPPPPPGGPDAPCSAQLAAFHFAYLCQSDDVDKLIFELHYWHRVKRIGQAARALGISRKTWYGRLVLFRARVRGQACGLGANGHP